MRRVLLFLSLNLLCCFCFIYSHAGVNRGKNKTAVAYRNNYQRVSAGYTHTLEIREGTLWAWGSNIEGQLGDGSQTNRTSSVQVGIVTNWVSIAAGQYHSLGLRADGTLWAWGNNDNGQLGQGNTTRKTSPTRVGTDSNWVEIAVGSDHSLALK